MTNAKYLKNLFLSLLTLFAFACAPTNNNNAPRHQPTPEPQQSYLEHTITYSGETLAEIASWYTGKGLNWTILRDANPGVRPDRLRLGQVILIPRNIVTNDRPFSRKALKKKSGDASSSSASSNGEASSVSSEGSVSSSSEASSEASSSSVADPVSSASAEPTPAAVMTPEATPAAEVTSVPEATAKPSSKDLEREKLLDELLK